MKTEKNLFGFTKIGYSNISKAIYILTNLLPKKCATCPTAISQYQG